LLVNINIFQSVKVDKVLKKNTNLKNVIGKEWKDLSSFGFSGMCSVLAKPNVLKYAVASQIVS
jgi:hypothetical protein